MFKQLNLCLILFLLFFFVDNKKMKNKLNENQNSCKYKGENCGGYYDIKCCDGFYCKKYPNGLGTCKDCKDKKCGIFSFSECCKNMECTSFWYGDCI